MHFSINLGRRKISKIMPFLALLKSFLLSKRNLTFSIKKKNHSLVVPLTKGDALIAQPFYVVKYSSFFFVGKALLELQ